VALAVPLPVLMAGLGVCVAVALSALMLRQRFFQRSRERQAVVQTDEWRAAANA